MIRCVRIFTNQNGGSSFEEGVIDLARAVGHDKAGDAVAARSIQFRETPPHSGSPPHNAPIRQLVITLSGTLNVKTADGACVVMHPGDVILADDGSGTGHSWELIDDQPWRRAYVVLEGDGRDFFSKS